MIYFTQTFFDSSIPPNDEILLMKRNKLTRADNPSDSKKGGSGIYYKELSLVKVKNLNECTIFKVSIKNMWFHSIDRLVKHNVNLTFF